MITEAQRRALFALREALRLCATADVVIDARKENILISPHDSQWAYQLLAQDVNDVLCAHPESET